LHDDKTLKQYDKWGVARPSQDKHGEDSFSNPISDQLKSLNPRNWRQMGNMLICDTDVGEMHQTIPTTHLLDKLDERGLPTFKKL
jgi:hypothetical protein